MFRSGGVVVPKNSSLLETTAHDRVPEASDASKINPTICLAICLYRPLLIRTSTRNSFKSARARGNSQRKRRVEVITRKKGLSRKEFPAKAQRRKERRKEAKKILRILCVRLCAFAPLREKLLRALPRSPSHRRPATLQHGVEDG